MHSREAKFGSRRRRRVRRIEASEGYVRLLKGELDSRGYAKTLVNSNRIHECTVEPHRPGPIALAAARAGELTDEESPSPTVRPVLISPEYRRFIQREISSPEYAASVASCARLESEFRAPAVVFRLNRRGFLGSLFDLLRATFLVLGFGLTALALVPLLVALGVGLTSAALSSTWTLSVVGGLLLATTVLVAGSPLLLGGAHYLQRKIERSA